MPVVAMLEKLLSYSANGKSTLGTGEKPEVTAVQMILT